MRNFIHRCENGYPFCTEMYCEKCRMDFLPDSCNGCSCDPETGFAACTAAGCPLGSWYEIEDKDMTTWNKRTFTRSQFGVRSSALKHTTNIHEPYELLLLIVMNLARFYFPQVSSNLLIFLWLKPCFALETQMKSKKFDVIMLTYETISWNAYGNYWLWRLLNLELIKDSVTGW